MKTNKNFKIALVLIILFLSMNNIVFADNFDFSGFEGQVADTALSEPVQSVLGAVLSVVRIIGTGIAIIILAYIGMKYMMAAPGDRADFKKGAIQYVVGAIVVFGASNILAFLIPVIERLVQ